MQCGGHQPNGGALGKQYPMFSVSLGIFNDDDNEKDL